MFTWDRETKKITLSRGDTGSVPFQITGVDFGTDGRVVWTMKSAAGTIVKEGVYAPEGNIFWVQFNNGDTDGLQPGNYEYDARAVLNPVYDTEGRIVDGDWVRTPTLPLTVQILRTVGDI